MISDYKTARQKSAELPGIFRKTSDTLKQFFGWIKRIIFKS